MNSFRFVTMCIALVLSVISLRAQELVQGAFRSLAEVRVVSVKWDLSKVGSFTNLMGDAFEKAGKDLGKYT